MVPGAPEAFTHTLKVGPPKARLSETLPSTPKKRRRTFLRKVSEIKRFPPTRRPREKAARGCGSVQGGVQQALSTCRSWEGGRACAGE